MKEHLIMVVKHVNNAIIHVFHVMDQHPTNALHARMIIIEIFKIQGVNVKKGTLTIIVHNAIAVITHV